MNTRRLLISALLLYLASLPLECMAAAGDVDLSFNPGLGVNDYVYAVAFQADGKAILGGVFTSPGTLITRLNTNGAVDTNFNVGTGANGVVHAVAVQTDGKILVGGSFTTINGIARNRLARLNGDGSLDTSFNTGTGPDARVRVVRLQPNGKILIGGDFLEVNQTTHARVARLNADGSVDESFNPAASADQPVYTIVAQPDGKILLGGYFLNVNDVPRSYIARLSSNGSLDDGFEANADLDIDSIALQPDGRIVLGGGFTTVNGVMRSRIARLHENGALDDSFDPGDGPDFHVGTVAVQPDGKILVGGNFGSVNGVPQGNIARLNSSGSVDSSFASQNGTDGPVHSLVVLNGKILAGGAFRLFNGLARNFVAQLKPNGSADTGFVPNTGADYPVVAIATAPDGKILVGGYFTSINGISRNHVARLNPNGTLDSFFNVGLGANGRVAAVAAQTDGKVLVGGLFTSFDGTNRNRIARLSADGSLDHAFDPALGANGDILSLARGAEGKVLIAGEFTSFDGTNRNHLARLNADGRLDLSFNPGTGANLTVRSIVAQPDGSVFVGGDFVAFNQTNRSRIARLNSNGGLDNSFNPGSGANGTVECIAVQADGKVIIGGQFTSINGTNRNRIARLNPSGGLDLTFAPGVGADGFVLSVALRPDGKILLGGDFFNVGGVARRHIALLNPNGSLDVEFNPGTGANDTVSSVVVQADGKALASGFFNLVNGIGRSGVVRFEGTFASPTLAITRTGTDVITSWPASFASFTLQTTDTVQTNEWINVSTKPGEIAGRFVVTNSAVAPKQFFRLKSP